MCIKSEGNNIFLNMQPVIKYEIKPNIISNNEAKGIFLELVQNDGNNKSFKMLPEL